jgi:hypothetical protein
MENREKHIKDTKAKCNVTEQKSNCGINVLKIKPVNLVFFLVRF